MSNSHTLEEVLARAETLGEEQGTGDMSLPMLALLCAEEVRDNGLKDIAVVKGKPNDVTRLYERWAKGRARTAPAEKAAKSLTSQVAKLQAVAKAAKKFTDFAGDVMPRVVTIREAMILDTNGPKVWPLYAAYVAVAVEQIKDTNSLILTDEQIADRVRKPVGTKTLVEVIEGLRDTCKGLVDPDGEIALPNHLDEMKVVLANFANMLKWAEREAMTPEERETFDAGERGRAQAIADLEASRAKAEKAKIAEALKASKAIEADKAEKLAA